MPCLPPIHIHSPTQIHPALPDQFACVCLRFSWTILLQLPEQRAVPGTSPSSAAPELCDLQGRPDSPGGVQKRKRDDGAARVSQPPDFAVPLPPMTAALLSRSSAAAPDSLASAQPLTGSQPRLEVVDYPGAGERGHHSGDTDGGSSSRADNAPSSSNPLTALPLTGLTECSSRCRTPLARQAQCMCIHDTRAPSADRRYVKLWGWEPLPHGTEQLLHNILQALCAAPFAHPCIASMLQRLGACSDTLGACSRPTHSCGYAGAFSGYNTRSTRSEA